MADRSPLGLLDTDSLIDEEDRAIQQTVRKFVDDRIRPHIAEWYEKGNTPVRDLARELGGIGALGMHLDGYGCAGTTTTAYGLACLEVEAGDSGIRSLMSVQGSLAMYAIHAHGSEEQKEQWLPEMAKGEKVGCFGLTESDFGSNPAGMRTRAKQDGSGDNADWVLDGSKMWITNGSIADVAVVWAQTDGRNPRLRRTHGDRRLLRPRDQAEDVHARLGHERAGPRRRPTAGRRGAAGRHGAARSAQLPDRGAVRDHLRLHRCRSGLPRGDAALRGRARDLRQSRWAASSSPRPSSPT